MATMTHEKKVECVQAMLKKCSVNWETIQNTETSKCPLDRAWMVLGQVEYQLNSIENAISIMYYGIDKNTNEMNVDQLFCHEMELIITCGNIRYYEKDLDVYEYAIAGVEAELARLGTASDSIG